MTIQTKAIEQQFHVVFILYKEVLNFNESFNENLMCDHSKKATEKYFHFGANCSCILGISREEASSVLT